MVYKGMIVKIEKDFAIVLTQDMKYVKIIKKIDMIIGKNILFVKEDMYHKNIKEFSIVAVILLLICSSFLVKNLDGLMPVSYAAVVSLDINPSIEFQIDEKSKVVKMNPMNEDAKHLIDKNLEGMSLENAVSTVIDYANKESYLSNEKNTILLGTVSVKEGFHVNIDQLEKTIQDVCKENEELEEINLVYVNGTKKDLEEAKKQNISIGKYEMNEQFKDKNVESGWIPVQKIKKQDIKKGRIEKIKLHKNKNSTLETKLEEKNDKKQNDKKQNDEKKEKIKKKEKEKSNQKYKKKESEKENSKNKKKEKNKDKKRS